MYRPFSYSKHQNVENPGYYHRGYEGYKLPSYAMTAHKNPYPAEPKKWPEDIECVMPSSDPHRGAIYISNVEAAENIHTLNKHSIKAVMTCARGYERNIPKDKLEMFQYYACDDKESCIIDMYFDSAADFIVKALQKTNILVHCIAGVSRSVSMVIAYLIREKGMSYDEAYRTIKARRKIIHPNDGFIDQLKKYANSLKSGKKQIRKEIPSTRTPEKRIAPVNDYRAVENKRSHSLYLTEHKIRSNFDEPVQRTNNRYEGMGMGTSLQFIEFEEEKRNNKKEDAYHTPSPARKYPMETRKVETEERSKLFGNNPEGTSSKRSYFEKMNQQLNAKIQAIHQKYEKQREQLLSKRNYPKNDPDPILTRGNTINHFDSSYDRIKSMSTTKKETSFGQNSDRYDLGGKYTGYGKHDSKYFLGMADVGNTGYHARGSRFGARAYF